MIAFNCLFWYLFLSDSPDIPTICFGKVVSKMAHSPSWLLFKLIYKIYTIWCRFVWGNEGHGSLKLNARELNVDNDPDESMLILEVQGRKKGRRGGEHLM